MDPDESRGYMRGSQATKSTTPNMVHAESSLRVITRDRSPRFATPGHRIRSGNIAETASAEKARNLGSRTTKVGDKVELMVTSKPASAHNRCAYEQRHSVSSLLCTYAWMRRAAIAIALSTRRFTRRARAYNTVLVQCTIPRVRGVDYHECDVSLRYSWRLR